MTDDADPFAAETSARALMARLRTGAPPNIALMHLLIAAPSPGGATQALAAAARVDPSLAGPLDAVARLWAAHPAAWATVRAVAGGVDHAPALATSAATLDRWRASFDRLAVSAPEAGVALYALGDPGLLARATAEVVEMLEAWGLLGPERDALDLGCGMGRFCEALAPHLRGVVGIDLSAAMVEEARRRSRNGNVRYAAGTGRDLAGLADASVDLVLAADVFPYLVEAGLAERHVAEVARVLRPGGACVVLNYSYRGDGARDAADLAAAAAAHGLAVERAGECPFRWWDAAAFLLRRNG